MLTIFLIILLMIIVHVCSLSDYISSTLIPQPDPVTMNFTALVDTYIIILNTQVAPYMAKRGGVL